MLTQKFVLGYSSKILAQLITLGVTIVVARVAGPGVLGTLAFGQAFVSMWLFLADLGLGIAHVKIVSEGKVEADANATFGTLKSILNVLFGVTFAAAFWFSIKVLGLNYKGVEHQLVVWISLGTVVLGEFARIPSTTFMAHAEQAKQDVPDFVQNLLHQGGRLALVLLGFGAVALSASGLVAAAVFLPAYFYLFRRYPRGKFRFDLAKRYFAIALPITVFQIINQIMMYSDRVLLQYIGSSEDVGYYVAGYRIGGMVLLVATAMGNLFFPLFSSSFAENRTDEILGRTRRYERLAHVFLLPGVAFLAVFSPALVKFALGKDYFASIPVLMVLAFAAFVSVTNLPYGNVLAAKGRFTLATVINGVNLCLYLGLAVALSSPRALGLRAFGMGLALLASYVFAGAAWRLFARRDVPGLKLVFCVPHLLYGVGLGGAFWLVYRSLLARPHPEASFLLALVFLPAYFGGLWMLKLIEREDWQYLFQALNARKLWEYIQRELSRTKNRAAGGRDA